VGTERRNYRAGLQPFNILWCLNLGRCPRLVWDAPSALFIGGSYLYRRGEWRIGYCNLYDPNLFIPTKSKRPALGGAFVYDLFRSYGFTVCVAWAPLATATAALGRLEVANGVF